MTTREMCCFESCGLPATHRMGGEVYFPMCTEHACQYRWQEYCATHTLPDGIPSNPDEVYAKEWRGWADWVGQALP